MRHEFDAPRHRWQEDLPIVPSDALASDPGDRFEIVLTNPPFGKKSSITIVADDGKVVKEKEIIERDDFWATTSNKQLNFLQHVKTLLKPNGRAAIVLPDNVLFEGGAGRPSAGSCSMSVMSIRCCVCRPVCSMPRASRQMSCFLTANRLPRTPWTKKLWIYDLRTNKHFTLKDRSLETGRSGRIRPVLQSGQSSSASTYLV